MTGSSAGTMAFMARPQLTNYKFAKPEVDVWATHSASTAEPSARSSTGTTFRHGSPLTYSAMRTPP
ncbi:hypothetical protein AB0E01_27560 [Nocardia vinacea]|uniref:hypothetical protein n=1 Tax=Nocardia vinacea TaxID=96468 RepID=UPI0033CC6150